MRSSGVSALANAFSAVPPKRPRTLIEVTNRRSDGSTKRRINEVNGQQTMFHSATQTMLALLALTKPRIILLVLFTGLPVMAMGNAGWPGFGFALSTLLGISLAAGAANTFNCYIERDLDALMERTATRPLPAKLIAPSTALAFGLALAVIATAVLNAVAGTVAA